MTVTSGSEDTLIPSSIKKILSGILLTVHVYQEEVLFTFHLLENDLYAQHFLGCPAGIVANLLCYFKLMGPPPEKFSSRLRSNVEDGDGG